MKPEQATTLPSDPASLRRQLATRLAPAAGDDLAALLQAALTAYENARADGLCHEGAWECALAAVQGVSARP